MRLTNPLMSADEAIELIKNGVDIHRLNILNETPLFNFAYVGNISVCEVFIQHGANVNHINYIGKTPLFMLTDIKMIQFFIDHGADVNIRDNRNHTILYYQHLPLSKLINGETPSELSLLFINAGAIPSEIETYKQLRHLYSEEQQEAFDMFMTITNNDDDFFHMCLAYQEGIKNGVKIEIKEMDIA